MTADEPEFLEIGDVLELHATQLEVFGGARNHPFVDGNKRAGLLSALVFLDLNGFCIDRSSGALYDLTMAVAEGRIDKAGIAAALEQVARAAR